MGYGFCQTDDRTGEFKPDVAPRSIHENGVKVKQQPSSQISRISPRWRSNFVSLTLPLAQFTKIESRSSSNHQAKFQESPPAPAPAGDLISLIVARLSRNLGKHQAATVSPRSPVSCFGRIEVVAGIGHAFDVSSLGSCPEEDNIVL
ncbi:hypothetical protein OIU78_004661 [Salix suchowensis]|nr:hypothetical protein OIU78_004661 [Salix suchowensis]